VVELSTPRTLGIVGGGQLGRMLTIAARDLGYAVLILDPQPDSPAGQLATDQLIGDLRDPVALRALADRCDVLTVEIEHVNTAALQVIADSGTSVYPDPRVLALIQDKYAQKEALAAAGLPVAPFHAGARPINYPAILKARYNAYDGRGNITVADAEALPAAIAHLGGDPNSLYTESIVPFVREVTIMVARGQDGTLHSFPPIQTFHRDHILRVTIAPAPTATAAIELAERAVTHLNSVGLFGVELFGLVDGTFLINEIAPRPHNAGHLTIEACRTDQFTQHIRAVMGLPLGDSALIVPAALMINLLGDDHGGVEPDLDQARSLTSASVHWYGKAESRPRRKLGHVTFIGSSLAEVIAQAHTLTTLPADLPTMPPIGIIMGSDSDLPTMQQAADLLRALGIDYELTIVSAHRTPDRMFDYARGAAARGLRVIIAGAGGAAHLPGMVAALTPLPVIGVPIRTEALGGVDSLYSIVQMPRGVPVATIAIGNAINAALLAARILATTDPALMDRLITYQRSMTQDTLDKAHKLETTGR